MNEGPTPPRAPASTWGWTASLLFMMAAGLLWVAFGFNAGRRNEDWAPLVFWVGLGVIVLPASARLLAPRVHRTERLAIVVGLGMALYGVYVLRSPIAFTNHDELVHLRTFLDIVRSGRLFSENPLLLVSPFYPGMESAAAAIAQVSGLDSWAAGIVLIGVMRLTFVLAAFLLFESVSGSAWIAGAASLIYMANPDFVFFASSFAYESFALPLAVAALWMLRRRQSAEPATRIGLTAAAILCLAAVVTSHHVTAAALILALLVWSAIEAVRRRAGGERLGQGVGGMATIGLVAAVTWVLYVATETLKYLGSPLLSTADSALRFLAGEAPGRALFGSAGGGAPGWERVVSFAATLWIVLALLAGLVILWRRYRARPAAVLLGVIALAYPASLALRLTSSGGLEVASRANSFVFVGLAFVLALALARMVRLLTVRRALVASPVAAGSIGLIFAGGIVLGSSWWSRLPGPFLVGGESRAVGPQGSAAATWMLDELGPGNRVSADRTNRLALGSVGDQRVVFDARDPLALWPLYAAPTIDGVAADTIREGNIRYVLVDRRLSTALPMIGYYFDQQEQLAGHKTPLPAESLAKFDLDARLDRVYDSGDLQIYDVGRLAR